MPVLARANVVLALCLASGPAAPAAATEHDADRLSGEVRFVIRDLDVSGSQAKHDEDFDGLASGLRLDDLLLEWHGAGGGAADHVRFSAAGLGGDPDQHVALDVSRSGVYQVSMEHSSRRFVYDLFALSDDEDGHAFNTRSERTAVDVTWQALPRVALVAGFERRERSGDRVFMKDISRDVFLMDAPADDRSRTFWLGTELKFGDVRIDFRQALRETDRLFRNTTQDDPGLGTTNRTVLDDYEWEERDAETARLTTLRVRAPLGKRAWLNAGYHGTLLGPERFDSRARQDATGTAYTGGPLVIAGGFSAADISRDHALLDAEIAFRPVTRVVLRLGWRSLDITDDGALVQDLAGSGTVTARDVTVDVSSSSLAATVEYHPVPRLGLSAGYRIADRTLRREGQGGVREGDFRSSDDATLQARVAWRPLDWFRLSAEREQADLDAALSALSPLERDRTRLRLAFTPRKGLEFGVTGEEHESENPLIASRSTGRSFSARVSHQAHARVSWGLAVTRSDVLRVADVIFDGAAFGGPNATFPGRTIHDVDQRHVAGHVRLDLPRRFTAGLRFSVVEARGRALADGSDPNVPPAVPSAMDLDQDLRDWEVEFERQLARGFFVGTGLRWIDLDDADDRLDYEANVVELRVGHRF